MPGVIPSFEVCTVIALVFHTSLTSLQTVFAVPLSCEGCIKSVSTSLYDVPGISSVKADLDSQLVSVVGTAPPSQIVAAIEATGKDAILRGSGKSDSESGTICRRRNFADMTATRRRCVHPRDPCQSPQLRQRPRPFGASRSRHDNHRP